MTYLPNEPEINTLLKDLPDTVPRIVETVQNTLLHIFWADRYGEKLTEERSNEVNIRSAANILRRAHTLKQASLTEKRLLSERVIGNCRDFTVLSVALMRSNGIPARARCGFGAYFSSPDSKLQYMDHWVVEYWNVEEDRWGMVDSQLDVLQRKVLKLDFDPLDVPHDRFITGGAAWQMCRVGKADPESFGIFDMSGLGFIRGDMIRDLAALGKIPLLPWDCWGVMLDEDIKDVELLDQVSDVTQPDTRKYDEIAELNKHPRLCVPETIISWMGGAEPCPIKLSCVIERLPIE
jgi:hypothetical protein